MSCLFALRACVRMHERFRERMRDSKGFHVLCSPRRLDQGLLCDSLALVFHDPCHGARHAAQQVGPVLACARYDAETEAEQDPTM